MTYRGVRHGPAYVVARLEKGEAVDPGAYHFRIAPLFETASAQYAWINMWSRSASATDRPTVRSTASSRCCESTPAASKIGECPDRRSSRRITAE